MLYFHRKYTVCSLWKEVPCRESITTMFTKGKSTFTVPMQFYLAVVKPKLVSCLKMHTKSIDGWSEVPCSTYGKGGALAFEFLKQSGV